MPGGVTGGQGWHGLHGLQVGGFGVHAPLLLPLLLWPPQPPLR